MEDRGEPAMTFTVTYRADGRSSRVLRRRKPCRRAADRAPICGRERIGESASLGKTRRNVAVECRVAAEFVADAFLGVEHKDGNPDVVANGFHDGCEISVAGDEDKAVGASFVCVAQHRVGDVHVRHLLSDAKHLDASVGPSFIAGSAGFADGGEEFGLFSIAAFDNFDERSVCKRDEVLSLPLCMALVNRFVDYARREVLDGDEGMIGIEKLRREFFKVKPLIRSAAELSVVEIAGVNVDYRVFHSQLLKVQEPGLRPAPRRLPESRRVKRPVIGGGEECIKIRAVTQ